MVSQRMLPYVAGAELRALSLAKALIAIGVEVDILTTRYKAGLAAEDVIEGVKARRLPVLREPTSGPRQLASSAVKASQFFAAAAWVAANGSSYDVIHGHCLSSTTLGAALGARIRRRPILVKPSLGGPDGELSKIVSSPYRAMVLPLLRRVDRFAVIDAEIADELAGVGVSRERLISIPNGLDLERFHPLEKEDREDLRARLGLPSGALALFVGQLVVRKGVSQLLEAWEAVSRSLPTATLVFAGDGPLADEVKGRATSSHSRVMLLGVRDDVADLMRAADVLVLPSRNEGFANVVVEAMACGLPVISGRTGIARHLPIDGTAGRLIDPENPSDLAGALVKILSSPDRGAALGERGRQLVQQFDLRKVAPAYLALYESMLGRRISSSETDNRPP